VKNRLLLCGFDQPQFFFSQMAVERYDKFDKQGVKVLVDSAAANNALFYSSQPSSNNG
jgi:hypothetical protein